MAKPDEVSDVSGGTLVQRGTVRANLTGKGGSRTFYIYGKAPAAGSSSGAKKRKRGKQNDLEDLCRKAESGEGLKAAQQRAADWLESPRPSRSKKQAPGASAPECAEALFT